MGIDIIQVMPGRDIATQRSFHKPIQNRIYEFAEVMRNIIYIVADKATKQCVVVDAVSIIFYWRLGLQGDLQYPFSIVLGY